MTSNPLSIPHNASAHNAAQLLNACRIRTAPVIDEGGRLIGVVSSSDLFDYCVSGGGTRADTSNHDFVVNKTNCGIYPGRNRARTDQNVLQIMNPDVFSVQTDDSISKVIKKFVKRGVRRLFVTDQDSMLVGEIDILELLRKLGKLVDRVNTARLRP
jgi:predicted transcriptional regulator